METKDGCIPRIKPAILETVLLLSYCVTIAIVTGVELDPNCISQEISHMGETRNCCQITCEPGKVPKLCVPKSPYTSRCERCPPGTYSPLMISFGERDCLKRKICDDEDNMFYDFLGNETHDAVCACEEGFILTGEDPYICAWDPVKETNTTGFVGDHLGGKSICKISESVAEKFQLKWSSFFIGGCAVFLACFTGVGLWCFFVYCDRCRKERKSDYKPVSWNNLRSKKQRILGGCQRDQDFRNKCKYVEYLNI